MCPMVRTIGDAATAARAAALALVLAAAPVALGQAPKAEPGLRVHNSDIHDPANGDSGGSPSISLVGTRNGAFSGKVVVASSQPITGLRAAVSELGQADGKIPSSRIRVRYEVPWDASFQGTSRPRGPDILMGGAPAELPAGRVPVWITVKVPKDAKAGAYAGQLTIEAKGLSRVTVPVKLDVRDWTLPDPQDYRTWVELVHQPDTLAIEYDVPLWSDRHWDLVAKTLDLIADTGSRVIYIPLIANTNYGNAESMVRWIKKGQGKYEHDFSAVDKYLDLVAKHLGAPKIAQVYAWEVYLVQPKQDKVVEVKGREGSYEWRESSFAKALQELKDKGPAVTVFDSATGKTETVRLPRYEDPAAKALWQPVWDGIRKRLAQRGWDKSMMIGNLSDRWPTKEEIAVLSELSGGAPWTSCMHHSRWVFSGKAEVHGAPVGYTQVALDFYFNFNPARGERSYGWKQALLHTQYWRFQHFNGSTRVCIHHEAERLITGNKRGLAHIGADFWPCIKDKRGRRRGPVNDRFPESYWHSLNIGAWMLAPGPNGPVGTARLELFRQGIQECEARIAVERALTDDALKSKLGAELAKRAQDHLDQRLVSIWKGIGVSDADLQKHGLVKTYRSWYYDIAKRADPKAGAKWYVESGWQERAGKLFDLAGEVQGRQE